MTHYAAQCPIPFGRLRLFHVAVRESALLNRAPNASAGSEKTRRLCSRLGYRAFHRPFIQSLDSEVLEFAVERASADLQHFGGPLAVAAGQAKGIDDVQAFDLGHAQAG